MPRECSNVPLRSFFRNRALISPFSGTLAGWQPSLPAFLKNCPHMKRDDLLNIMPPFQGSLYPIIGLYRSINIWPCLNSGQFWKASSDSEFSMYLVSTESFPPCSFSFFPLYENIHKDIFSIPIPILVSFSQTLIFNNWHQIGSNGTDAKIGILD